MIFLEGMQMLSCKKMGVQGKGPCRKTLVRDTAFFTPCVFLFVCFDLIFS